MTISSNLDHSQPNRREAMLRGMTGALALAVIGRERVAQAAIPTVATPSLEVGPYWVDEKLLRTDVRADTSTGYTQLGVPVYLAISVSQLNSDGSIAPLPGAYVDIWNCNALGIYSDESSEGTTGVNYLRGYQITNEHGNVEFITIYSGWYSGRTPHIHIRVRIYDGTTVTYNFVTQLFYDETITDAIYESTTPYSTRPVQDTTNAADRVYTGSSADDEITADAGVYTLMRMAEGNDHVIASYNFLINLSDTGYNNADGTASGSTTAGTTGTVANSGGPTTGGTPPSGTPPTGTPPTAVRAAASVTTQSTKSTKTTRSKAARAAKAAASAKSGSSKARGKGKGRSN